jgi:hypothetical protein
MNTNCNVEYFPKPAMCGIQEERLIDVIHKEISKLNKIFEGILKGIKKVFMKKSNSYSCLNY